jgi:RecA-family ATPase
MKTDNYDAETAAELKRIRAAGRAHKANSRDHSDEPPLPHPDDKHQTVQPAPLPFLDMSRWDDQAARPREWAVEDRIPMYQPHLITGHGAIGKSLLELMRSVAHVLGKPWLGMPVRQGNAVYFGAEDDEDELHRRLEDILRYYGATFADVVGRLHLLSYAGLECLLGVPDGIGIIRPTELFNRLLAAAIALKPVSLTIDTLTDVYAGDEVDRSQTTQFVKLLTGMAIKARCSVAILAHPSNAGMSSGSGISGSTGWHNKVRSRLYMMAPKAANGEEIDSDVREIQFLKNNYGKQGDSILVRWKAGVFVPETATNGLEKVLQDHNDDQRFLDQLKKFEGQGRNLSHKPNANEYGPRVFAKDKGCSGKRYEQAMERLFEANRIHVRAYGPPSKGLSKLAVGPRQDGTSA